MVRTVAIVMILAVSAQLLVHAQLKDRNEAPLELPANMRDEDEDVVNETNYAFNPIQAKKEFKVGNFYARKGNHRAAAGRYLEATRWDPGYAEAFWKLGDAREELGQHQHALDAYRRYIKLEPDSKQAKDIGGRLAELEKQAKAIPEEPEKPEHSSTAKLPKVLQDP